MTVLHLPSQTYLQRFCICVCMCVCERDFLGTTAVLTRIRVSVMLSFCQWQNLPREKKPPCANDLCVNQCVCALRSGEQSSNSPQSSRVLPSMANIRSRGQKQKDAGPGFTKDSMAFQTLSDLDALKAHQPALSDTHYTIKTRNWSSMFPCTETMRMRLQQRAQGSYTDTPW